MIRQQKEKGRVIWNGNAKTIYHRPKEKKKKIVFFKMMINL